jgi:hypothetical protein
MGEGTQRAAPSAARAASGRTLGRLEEWDRRLSAIIAAVRFTVTIEGAGWTDVQQLELPRLPREGELIETKYGTCRVTHSEATPDAAPVDGEIVCSVS